MVPGKPAAIIALLALPGCAATPAEQRRSPAAQRELARALEGRAAGPAVRCIRNFPTSEMQVVDDFAILFRDGRTIYLQQPRGGCPGIGNHSRTLVTRPFGVNQLCDGDINHLVDFSTGMQGGACVFGPFVPYTRTGA